MRPVDFTRGISRVAVTGLVLAIVGCDAAFLTEAPVQVCQEVATQCQLAKGPLGVCERVACAENQADPCFACTPQH